MSLFLVTGATGFIGRHLCSLLSTRGYTLRGALRKWPPPADFPVPVDWVEVGEIGPDTDWSTVLSEVKYVVHLAAHAHQMDQLDRGRSDEFLRVNTLGTRRLAQAVASAPSVLRLLFISSVGAVRSFASETITEATPCMPDTAYGRSKRAAELAIEEILHDSQVDWCILRPTLVYGPGNPGNMARLLKLIDLGIPLPLAAVTNQRSFVFVGNLVDAIAHCTFHPAASRRTFLISDGECISTPVLLRQLVRHTGKPLRLFPLPVGVLRSMGKIGDVISALFGRSIGVDSYSVERLIGSLAIDASALRETVGWQPPFSMEAAFALTLQPGVNSPVALPAE